MATTVAKQDAIQRPPPPAAPRSGRARRRQLTLAGIILTLGLTALGTGLTVDRLAGGSARTVAATSTPAWKPIATPWLEPPWLERLDVIHLKKQLVRAGYSIRVDSSLDPVTKSALADHLRPDSAHPLSPSLANALMGTVITGRRNPAAWNSRFGLHRRTKFVERPLTGPGGQLDSSGNSRPPAVPKD